MTERFDWHDDVSCFPVETLQFETTDCGHNRTGFVAWIPWDETENPMVYRTIITQFGWIRTVIGSSGLVIKRSKEGANAVHVASSSPSDVNAVADIVTELVNFRMVDPTKRLARKPVTDHVNVFMVNDYNGDNIIGTKNAYGKNFVVPLADAFNVKLLITHGDDPSSLRVAIVGRKDDAARARDAFESFIVAMANGGDEKVEQASIVAASRAGSVPRHVASVHRIPSVEAVSEEPEAPAPAPEESPQPVYLAPEGRPLVYSRQNSFYAYANTYDQVFYTVFTQLMSQAFVVAQKQARDTCAQFVAPPGF